MHSKILEASFHCSTTSWWLTTSDDSVMTRSDMTKNTPFRDVSQSNHGRQLGLFNARVGLSDVGETNFRSAWQFVAGPTNQRTYLYSHSACHATCILEPRSSHSADQQE